MEIIAHFAPTILLYIVLILFISHKRAETDKDLQRAEWERDAELARMTPADRLRAVTRRFGWIMRMAAQRFATFNTVVLGLVVWFFFLSPLPARGSAHTFFVLTILAVSLATRQGTRNGPAAKKARAYNVFAWGYNGRWLDIGFATVAAGVGVLTFKKQATPFVLGVYLGAAGTVTGMLLRWAVFGREPWNPFAKKVEDKQGETS